MPENIITNADDVDIIIESKVDKARLGTKSEMGRFKANEFTITVDQNVTSEGTIGHNVPAGLSKGDLEYSFDYTISGDSPTLMGMVSDDVGDSLPFDMTARKVDDAGNTEWEYALITCLADTEEISGTTGETLEVSVEGMSARLQKDV